MDEETKKAFEAVYGRIGQLSEDLLGDKDKPGVFEVVRSLTSRVEEVIRTLEHLSTNVRRLAYQQVAAHNRSRTVEKQLNEEDTRLRQVEADVSALKSAPGQQAIANAANSKTLRNNFLLYLVLGLISASYGWWLGQHRLVDSTRSVPHALPATVAPAPRGESK